VTLPRWQSARAAARLAPAFLILGVAKHVIPLRTLARWSWRRPRRGAKSDVAIIASQVLGVGSLLGLPDRDCLQRSLLLYRELAAAGWSPELVVGFATGSGTLKGHAWVRHHGDVLTEPASGLSGFDATLVFGAGGELI